MTEQSEPRGVYRKHPDGRLHCKHGLLLHGDSCVTCERDALTATGQAEQEMWARIWDRRPENWRTGGFVSPGAEPPRIFGFDPSSGPDHSVNVTATKIGGRYEYSYEELSRTPDPRAGEFMRAQEEAVQRMLNRHAEQIRRAAFRPGDPPWHFNCRSSTYGAHERPGVEIITNPADTRGLDAKRVGA